MHNPIAVLKEHYVEETRLVMDWFMTILEDGSPIVYGVLEYIPDHIKTESTFNRVQTCLNGFGATLTLYGYPEIGEQCKKAAREMEQFRSGLEDATSRHSFPLTHEDGVIYIRGLENPKAAAVSALALDGGLSYNDLLRDKHRLGKTHDGLVDVSQRQGNAARTAQGRLVEFDPSLLHEMDPGKEVIGVLGSTVFDPRKGSDQQREVFKPFMSGGKYTVDQLRAANAIHRLHRGQTLHEVAAFQGVAIEPLKTRLARYLTANQIELPWK